MQPLIAVTTSELDCRIEMKGIRTGIDSPVRTAVPENYLRAVETAGGIPVVLAPTSAGQVSPEQLSRFDGLVLSGGPDIEALTYGGGHHPEMKLTVERADQVELAILAAAEEADLPVLGICRGHQLINVHRGGTLIPHLSDQKVVREHRMSDYKSRHPVQTQAGSLLREMFGEKMITNSIHHQAVNNLGRELIIAARAADGVVEAIEDPSREFFVGVQWHPEVLEDHKDLFAAFIEAAQTSSLARH